MKFWWFIAIVGGIALIAAVFSNALSTRIFVILCFGLLASAFVAWVSIHITKLFIRYYADRIVRSGRVLIRSLAPVVGTEHQLSQTELHRIGTLLRRDLADLWMFRTAMDESKIRHGLTSITDNYSQITHFEFDRIKWLFKRGQQKLRKMRLALMTLLIFSGFVSGCVVGIYLQYWYHFLK